MAMYICVGDLCHAIIENLSKNVKHNFYKLVFYHNNFSIDLIIMKIRKTYGIDMRAVRTKFQIDSSTYFRRPIFSTIWLENGFWMRLVYYYKLSELLTLHNVRTVRCLHNRALIHHVCGFVYILARVSVLVVRLPGYKVPLIWSLPRYKVLVNKPLIIYRR